jgi:MFS family permease
MATAAGDAGEWSYWRALRSGRLGALLAGNLISSVGNGMIISALPLLTGAFFLGGLIYAPFTPIAYTYVQSMLTPDEQQPVVTLWAAGAVLAAPVGLALAGPLVSAAGAKDAMIISALLTIALVPLAASCLRRARP